MKFEVEPIGYVEGIRESVEDDYWGGEECTIVLSGELPPEALQGIDDFSHVEVLFLFDRVDPSKIVSGARHPRNNPDWPAVGILRSGRRTGRTGSGARPVASSAWRAAGSASRSWTPWRERR